MENSEATLLVVDDNEMNRDMLSRRLERKGYRVLTAEDGEKALAIVGSQAVDLVLLDIMMPGIDGVEVLRRLRRDHSQTQLPVIMATAKAESESMVAALEQGANDYVTKPLDFPVVLARVQAQLRTKEQAAAPRSSGEPGPGEIEPGVVLAGKYRLEERIGAGTFGTVYRGVHVELENEVAVKVLHNVSEESQKRFRLEGVAACRVRHPNAVAVSDFGVTDAGVAYLVMEFLRGRALVDELSQERQLTPRRCLEILEPVCEVLAEAHAAHLVHRDIKPENVFLHRSQRGERVKVLDFGIAKLVGEAVTRENLTAEGWVLGTPAYMAPERIQPRELDGKTDVYSLGCLLFEMLTGKRPFTADNRDPMAMIMMHVNEKAPALRSVDPALPEELEAPVAWAMRKDPAQRPDARELAAAFAEAVAKIERTPAVALEPAAGLGAAAAIDHDAPTVSLAAPREEAPGRVGRWLHKIKRSLGSRRSSAR